MRRIRGKGRNPSQLGLPSFISLKNNNLINKSSERADLKPTKDICNASLKKTVLLYIIGLCSLHDTKCKLIKFSGEKNQKIHHEKGSNNNRRRNFVINEKMLLYLLLFLLAATPLEPSRGT